MKIIKRVSAVLLAAGLVSTSVGCSMETGNSAESENTDTVSLAYNQSQCATAGAVATFPTAYSYTSPTNYSTACNAVDATSMAENSFGNFVHWAGPLPTTAAACANSDMRAIWYAKFDGVNWGVVTDTDHVGVWSGGRCTIADISFASARGQATRIASTARTYTGTTFTTSKFTLSTHF
jgi:hypothetical protein